MQAVIVPIHIYVHVYVLSWYLHMYQTNVVYWWISQC